MFVSQQADKLLTWDRLQSYASTTEVSKASVSERVLKVCQTYDKIHGDEVFNVSYTFVYFAGV